jgi:hypothetical protein
MADSIAVVVPDAIDYISLANTLRRPRSVRGAAQIQRAFVNWHRWRREETVVFAQPCGPKTEMRIEADEVTTIVRSAGLLLNRTVELPPYTIASALGAAATVTTPAIDALVELAHCMTRKDFRPSRPCVVDFGQPFRRCAEPEQHM